MRKTYILLKDTPELKKGAILQEQCDDGDQDFICLNESDHQKHKEDNVDTLYGRNTVMKQPEWFEEVMTVTVTKKEKGKIEKILKRKLKEIEEE